MTIVGSIGVLRRVLVKGVVHSGLGEARRRVFITAFGVKVVVAYLPTLAPIGVTNEFRSLRGRFSRLVRALIHFNSKTNNK